MPLARLRALAIAIFACCANQVVEARSPHASNVSFRVAANSVDAGSSFLDTYLRGELFFDVANYPHVSASPLPIPTHLPFGFTVPNLTGPNALVEARAKFTHEVLSKLVIGAIALHVTGALKHHFIDHDGVLSRMLPFGAGIAAPDLRRPSRKTRAAPLAFVPSVGSNRGLHSQ